MDIFLWEYIQSIGSQQSINDRVATFFDEHTLVLHTAGYAINDFWPYDGVGQTKEYPQFQRYMGIYQTFRTILPGVGP